MSFSFAFILQCKRIARRKSALACFLLLPLLVMFLGFYLPRDTAGDAIRVGIYLPKDSPSTDELWGALRVHEDTYGYSLSFIPAESPEQLANQVAAGIWECGYLLPQDFRLRLRNETVRRLITRIDSPSTSLAAVINEAVSGALLDLCAPDLAISYMKQSGILPLGQDAPSQDQPEQYAPAQNPDDQQALYPGLVGVPSPYDELLAGLIPQFFNNERVMKAEIVFVHGPGEASATGGAGANRGATGHSAGSGVTDSTNADNGANSGTDTANGAGANSSANTSGGYTVPAILRGLTALFLFLFSCLCSLWFIDDRRSGFYRRLAPYLKPSALYPPYFCAAALFVGIEGLLALSIAGAFFPGAFAGFLPEALCLLLYLLYLASITYFLSGVFRRQEPLAASLPFLLIACLLLCPIFIDLGRFVPFAGKLAILLPPTFYLRLTASIGALADPGQLPAALQGFTGYLIACAALFVFARLIQGIRRD